MQTGVRIPMLTSAHFMFLCACIRLNFVTFPCGILGQVWYLIVLIPDLCRLTYFSYVLWALIITYMQLQDIAIIKGYESHFSLYGITLKLPS